MSLLLLADALRGQTIDLTFTLDLANGTDVTSVSSMAGVATDLGGLETDIAIVMTQTGSTNVWTGSFLPVWSLTPSLTKQQKWVVRVSGLVGTKGFAGAGHLTVENWR